MKPAKTASTKSASTKTAFAKSASADSTYTSRASGGLASGGLASGGLASGGHASGTSLIVALVDPTQVENPRKLTPVIKRDSEGKSYCTWPELSIDKCATTDCGAKGIVKVNNHSSSGIPIMYCEFCSERMDAKFPGWRSP